MTGFTSVRKLDEMKMMSRGNPDKIAVYTLAKKKYDSLVASHFTEDEPLPNVPNEAYVEQLKVAAETGDEAAKMRYEIAKDRREGFEHRHNGAHENTNQIIISLRTKLAAGEAMTKADVQAAERAARHASSAENIALYSLVKRSAE
ncbi:hypothetical protein [Bacillus sp. 37MA]|uniref:hypothetical protein n=1 Tax=Bacillus sp. 37MA TaxID=1132442 RepID=UPI0003702087|nr:hypothetical protein [Bacillus sp. 37MA]